MTTRANNMSTMPLGWRGKWRRRARIGDVTIDGYTEPHVVNKNKTNRKTYEQFLFSHYPVHPSPCQTLLLLPLTKVQRLPCSKHLISINSFNPNKTRGIVVPTLQMEKHRQNFNNLSKS